MEHKRCPTLMALVFAWVMFIYLGFYPNPSHALYPVKRYVNDMKGYKSKDIMKMYITGVGDGLLVANFLLKKELGCFYTVSLKK